MLVYRVELDDSSGPYYGNIDECITYNYNVDAHPGPYNDGIIDYLKLFQNGYRCGFIDKEQYQNWFFDINDRKQLHQKNFSLYEYKVLKSSVKFGKKQIMFPYNIYKRTKFKYHLITLDSIRYK